MNGDGWRGVVSLPSEYVHMLLGNFYPASTFFFLSAPFQTRSGPRNRNGSGAVRFIIRWTLEPIEIILPFIDRSYPSIALLFLP